MICRPSPTCGNITTDHQGRTIEYSAENELMRISEPGGAVLATNIYNAEGGLRLRVAGSNVSNHYYDGDQEVFEMDNTGSVWTDNMLRRYVRLPGPRESAQIINCRPSPTVDEALLMIDYTLDASCANTSAAACKVWAHQNRLGVGSVFWCIFGTFFGWFGPDRYGRPRTKFHTML